VAVFAVLLASSLPVLATSGRAVPRDEPFATTWFLVRLAEPIAVDPSTDRPLPLETGQGAVDALIEETGVREIEWALPVTGRQPRFPEAFRRHGLDRTYAFHVPHGADIPSLVQRFAALPAVEIAEPDYIGHGGAVVPDDPRFVEQWALDQASDADVDAPEAWATTVGGEVVVAILDSGIDSDHEDLVGKILPGHDFANDDSNPEDDHGHGTNVSSISAANSDNTAGIAGSCWSCPIMPLKVLDENNSGFYSWWADALVWATDNGARIINMSAGGTSASQTLLSAVRYAYDAGVIHVSITHNDNSSTIRYPGRYAETITLGGTNSLDRRANPFCYSAQSGSNYGPEIDVVAPGELILGAAPWGGYDLWCGTSQAAPLVAGLVGLVETLYPSVGREEVRHLLRSGAEDEVGRMVEDTPGFDIYHGWGRVNMDRTVRGTAASITLHVDGKSTTRAYFESANPLADSYDFVRGDLGALAETSAGVDLGTVVCLENDSPDPDTAGDEDTETPAAGDGFVYLGRFNAAPGPGWYGGSTSNRDRVPAAGNCPGCNDGILEPGEVCDGDDLGGETCQTQGFSQGTLACNATCDGFDTSACSTCGNSVCETLGGEDCLSCPDDCNGEQSGSPGDRYCCGDGDGDTPVGCEDPRCTANGNTCTG
jgi:hypothetical protein